MGCDIHIYAEFQSADGKFHLLDDIKPFTERYYGKFAFLAGVRNYSEITPIAEFRGLPEDASSCVRNEYECWYSYGTYLTVEELLAFDYDKECEDRRCSGTGTNGHVGGEMTCEPGKGEMTTYREFLGEGFFVDLEMLSKSGANRIVFWFDN